MHEKKWTKEEKEMQLCNGRVVGECIPRQGQCRMDALNLSVRCSGFRTVDLVLPCIEGLGQTSMQGPRQGHGLARLRSGGRLGYSP